MSWVKTFQPEGNNLNFRRARDQVVLLDTAVELEGVTKHFMTVSVVSHLEETKFTVSLGASH